MEHNSGMPNKTNPEVVEEVERRLGHVVVGTHEPDERTVHLVVVENGIDGRERDERQVPVRDQFACAASSCNSTYASHYDLYH